MIAATQGPLFGQVLPWLAALLAVVVVGGAGIWAARRLLRRDGGAGAGGFTLQELRDLKASGQISDEEFARARDSIIGRKTE